MIKKQQCGAAFLSFEGIRHYNAAALSAAALA
jgi:hypothetical protein